VVGIMDGNNKKTLWIVSELFYPEYTSTAYVLTVIAKKMVDHYNVRVLCGQPTYAACGIKAAKNEVIEGVQIRRCWGTTGNKNLLFFRIINFITISVSLFILCLWRFRRHDRVLVVTNPPMLPLLVTIACRLKRAHCILLVHDVYPEAAIVAGLLGASSWITQLFHKFMEWVCRSVDRIAVLGRDMQELIRNKRRHNPEDVWFIPNWGDVDEVYPLPRNENPLLKEWNLCDKFVIQNAGNIGWVHDVKMLVQTAVLLRDQPDMHFLILGTGRQMKELKHLIEQHQLTNFTIKEMRPRNEALVVLSACDVAISVFVPGMYGLAVPSRLYNIFASGKPLVAVTDPNSEIARIIEEEKIGWAVTPGNSAELAGALCEARNKPLELSDMGRRAREAALKKYSPDIILNTFVELIEGIGV
jgi:colanic acid biosynthesis glycosyl transferase WcaI